LLLTLYKFGEWALKKRTISGLMLVLLILCFLASAFNFQPVKAEPGTIIVPDDYSTIQEAINAANPGDTIYVREGTYYSGVNVNKAVSLIGENRETTIIDCYGEEIGFSIYQNYVNITGFTIEHASYGIFIDNKNYCNISGNDITTSTLGVYLYYSNYNNISGNQITYNYGDGINLAHSNNTIISGNNITENSNYGIYHSASSNNTISGNNIADNGEGIATSYPSKYNVISGNTLTENGYYGLALSGFSSGTISGNTIKNHDTGILLDTSPNNHIYHNNLIDNVEQTYISDSLSCVWDNGYPSGGNYWSDYNGTDLYSGPYQNETGNDLIADTPLVDSVIDHYPLMTQWSPNIPSDMVVAYPNEPGTLDPARTGNTASMELISNVYETLTFFDEEKTNQFIPHLATKWEISPDGLTYTFTIRQGVKFHNGETLTTEDVEYSLERFLVIDGIMAFTLYEPLLNVSGSRDAEGHLIVTGQQIDNAITRNQTTVTIHLAKPYPPFMQIISQAWSSILCKKWCISIGDWPGTWNNWTLYNRPDQTAIENQTAEPPGPHLNAMCGTGPYMLDYYRKGVEWSLVKFDNYWGGWPAPGSDSFLQRVTAKKIQNWEVRKDWFLEGQLDHTQVPTDKIDEVLGQPGIRCIYPLEELSCYAMFFTFNISVSSPYLGVPGGLPKGTLNESGIPPDFFSDINVRKGFAYAFNYTKLIEEVVRGEAYQPATPIIPGLPFYNPAQEKYAINLTKATEYFATAWNGQLMEKGFNFTICYCERPIERGNSWRQKACEIIKANVESISGNFHIQIQEIPNFSQYFSAACDHKLPIFLFGWLADFADPHDFAYGFMYSGGGFPPLQKYSNQTIDALVQQGIGTMNETARRQAYYELQSLYHKDCPSVPLYQPIGRRFERDWVQGWYYNPLLMGNYFYVQWKGSRHLSTTYSWPMFHHDLTHTGYSDSPAPNTNQTQWNYTIGNGVYSSPAVVGGKVYVGSCDNKTYCLDALTGAHVWNYTTGDIVFSSPAVVGGKVYVGSCDNKIYCLDASSGTLIWNYTTGGWVYSSPAVVGGKVYVGSCDNKIYCLDASSGTLIWNYTTGFCVYSSPAVVGGKVYVGSCDNKTYCLDALTGAHVWNYTTGDIVFSSPAVVDGKVYVGSFDNKIYCLDALTGTLIWNYTTGFCVYSSPAVVGGKVYVGSCDNKTYCLDALTGAHVWNYTTGGWVCGSSPAVADSKVYVGSWDNNVYCLNALTGAKIWSYATGDWVFPSPAVADGMVFVGSMDGKVYAFGNVVRSEDYPTIQAAINNATAGATIIIAPGIYHESLVINKTLTIIGLPGSTSTFSGGGSGIAITLLRGASGSIIAGIVITRWDQGILIIDATNVKIYDDIMSLMNCNGITLEGNNAANNIIYSNIFQDNTVAVNLTASSTNSTVYKNIISSNNIGLALESSGHVIYGNIISENQLGIDLSNSNGNIIYHNNFINNKENAKSDQYSNAWDNGYPSGGNYWSDYKGVDEKRGANQAVQGSDGIGDTQYTVAVKNIDRYPLLEPFNPHDIGITSVMLSKTVVGQGYSLHIDLKILNYGIYNETFVVTVCVNTATVATKTVSLMSRNSTIITFMWNTAGFVKGNYTIWAYASHVQGENDTADNSRTGGWVIVAMIGDITGPNGWPEGKCDIRDVANVARLFGVNYPDPKYNPNYDITGPTIGLQDGKIDIRDVAIVAKNFGKIDP
jgi:peptide/nickel transport system substrate-binding protein